MQSYTEEELAQAFHLYTNGADAAYRRMLEQGFQPPKPQEA